MENKTITLTIPIDLYTQLENLTTTMQVDWLTIIREGIANIKTKKHQVQANNNVIAWAKVEMAKFEVNGEYVHGDLPFLGGFTVKEYYALPDAEQERIWNEMYFAEFDDMPEVEIKPDAYISTR